MSRSSIPTDSPPDPAHSVLCPACGYDLRAATGSRCSECGLVVDLATLNHSAVPWAYRHGIGRLKAFLKTVRMVTMDARSLRHEASKPQSPRDAAAFRRWVIVPLAAAVAGLALLMIVTRGIEEVVLQQPPLLQLPPLRQWPSGFEQDLLVPWSAGIALRPALFGYAVLAAVYIAGAPGAIFRTHGMRPEQAEATRAMGDYVAAPLVWLLPAAAAFTAAAWLGGDLDRSYEVSRFFPVMIGAWWLLALLALGGTVLRTGQWRARVTHRGYATGFLAMGELLLRWIVGIFILLSVVPWCVGFLWIVLDSFRA